MGSGSYSPGQRKKSPKMPAPTALPVNHIVIGLESNNLQDYLDRVEGFAKVPLVS
jgi:hypothetical protein